MKKENISTCTDYFLFSAYIIFFASIVFSFRAISSISIGLILIAGLIRNRKPFHHNSDKKSFLTFLLGCGLLFFIQCFSLAYTKNIAEGMKFLQRSSGSFLIPFAVFSSRNFLRKMFLKLISYFTMILCLGSLYCLAVTIIKYLSGAPLYTFFYHDLVKPLSQHAIQFSIMVFIALVFLIESSKEKNKQISDSFSRSMIAFFSVFLILLCSKLIISFYIFYLFHFFFYKRFNGRKSLLIISVFIATVISIMLTQNPAGNRFRSIFKGNFFLFTQKKFDPGIYFNGAQFRLLEWGFTYEILNEQHAWLLGLTPGDAQSFLDKKYIETNMYTGIPGTQKHGFLGYHTHNQFLQSLLENGLPALAVFLFIAYSFFKMSGESKRKELKWLSVLLIIYCFADAPFETQYGIIIFTFFPAYFYLADQKSLNPDLSSTLKYHLNLIEPVSIKQPN